MKTDNQSLYKPLRYLFFALGLVFLNGCEKQKPNPEYLGVVNIEITGKKEALPHFEKGQPAREI